ncbi:putative amino acid permease [Talaromyces proteolyticus]|uniref:Amino acid permease n=1 Tax=Talaromyces proteolyticus TaxID=1131652 RepID=A0AAD4Q122_9EURO|nr:putative amino acid permease [Talaromyces proteolyticus]KAH8698294.1 putative amino acid permease [Talaromyces proteolyticus]
MEKSAYPQDGGAMDSSIADTPAYYGESEPTGSWHQRLVDSFKRDPNAHVTKGGQVGADGNVFDAEAAAHNTANSPLQRRLKSRHLQMIAIGGSIGTGLFVASGEVLATGGPASVVIAYILIGIMLYCTVHALGEMAVCFPVAGSFAAYSTRFIDPAWGFAMGWNYALQWLVVMPLEIVAASITIDYWHSSVSHAAWVAIFWSLIVVINLFGVRGYGEAEFAFAIIKVTAVVGFIILGVILNCGGGPNGGYIGGKYWHDPGAFHHGFKGLCSVFVNAAFAFAGTELVGLAAAETQNPRKSIPRAIKQVFWRIALFYVVALTVVGLLVPYTEPKLMNGKSSADASASPFVIAIETAGISGLPSVMNVVIMIAVLSVGNSSVYGSSRTLAALAEQGQAPRFLAYIDRQGRPLFAILVSSALGLLAFLAASDKEGDAFTWMLAISGLSSVFTWGSICLSHIRFRRAWKVQGYSLGELPFRSQVGVLGSWVGFIFNCLVLVAQFWVAFAPVGYASETAAELTQNFFSYYLAAPIVIAFYIPYKLYYHTPFMKADQMDLVTGRRELDVQHLIEEERAEQASWPLWRKVYHIFC